MRINPDGTMTPLEDVEQIQAVEAAGEKMAGIEAAAAADASAVLSMLAPATEILVVEKEIEVAGKMLKFGIKRLSHAEVSKLDAKKYRRGPNQQLIKDIEQEQTVGTAWLIATGVVKDINEGQTGPGDESLDPNWQPLFTFDQVLGGGKRQGLMSNPNPEAQDLIYQLTAAIWEVNPVCNPILAAASAAQMGIQE